MGCVLSIELMDSFGTRIEATFFNEAANFWGDRL